MEKKLSAEEVRNGEMLVGIIDDFFFHDYKHEETGLLNAIELASKILEKMEVKPKVITTRK